MNNKILKSLSEPEAEDRLFLVRLIVCLGLIAGFLSTYNLWINGRFFPVSPVTGFIPVLSPPFDKLLVLLTLVLLTLIIFYPRKYLFGAVLLSSFYLVLQDQTRLQPWFLQYLFLFGAVAWFESTPHRNNARSAVIICHTVMIGIYVWSGLHKLNYLYLHETFESVAVPLFELFPVLGNSLLPYLAAFSAIIVTGAGLSLIFRTSRKPGARLLILVHILILIMAGAGGFENDMVIWSWNICFILLVASLFLGKAERFIRTSVFIPYSYYHGLVILLIIFMPILNFGNIWDHIPSQSFYSGKTPTAVLNISNNLREKFPTRVQQDFGDMNRLIIRDWALAEMNVPAYPQPRVFKNIFRELCRYEERNNALALEIYDTADLITGKRTTEILFCREL